VWLKDTWASLITNKSSCSIWKALEAQPRCPAVEGGVIIRSLLQCRQGRACGWGWVRVWFL
jgi:hypothetical protein